MKKRKGGRVVLICECHLGERECRRTGEFAVAILGEHFLQIGASIRVAMEISIAFTEREISVRPTRAPRIVVEILLIFWDCEIVQFASKQAIGVLELTLISSFSFACRRLG